ncbi:MAG: hypothetical protein HOL43_07545 [Verrucomicrobiales bacterium]|nr:hypothetical protein [Verrucomicrobiales bacterium]
MALAMKDNPLFKFFSSLRLTVVLLALSLIIIFFGTMAQEPMGLNIAVDRYFKSWFVDWVAMKAGVIKTAQLFGFQWPPVTPEQILGDRGWPVFPGGYLVGTLLLVNLLTAHYARFELSAKKAGIFLTHIGIITLLLGQLFTDILQVESFVSMERGDRRNYSISFDDNELVFMHSMKGGSNRVVSIPEQMLKNKTSTEHPELKELKIETERYWVNAKPMTADQLIDLDGETQKELRNKVLEQVYGLINTRITRMEEYLRENTNAERRKELTGLKAIFIEQRAKEVELRQVADLLVRAGEMEMGVYGYQQTDSKIIFKDSGVRNLIVKIQSYDDQGTISSLFKVAVKERLIEGSLDEFNRYADDFLEKIKEYPGGAGENMVKNTRSFSERIKVKAKQHYIDSTQGKLGNFYRFVRPLSPVFDQNDRNLPAALIKVSKGGKELGKWLVTCSSDFQQSLEVDGETWKIILRPQRNYLDFNLSLVDLKWEKYQGTEIPKNFQSRVIVEDEDESRMVDIYMNNPLRQGGQTFYQYQMNQNQLGATAQTVLQVVKNPSWLTAYIGCLIVAAGLIYQFLYHLVGFARKRKKAAA